MILLALALATQAAPAKPAAAKAPSASQVAARSRMQQCSKLYQADKASNKLNGQKWPQYYSACNKKLKG